MKEKIVKIETEKPVRSYVIEHDIPVPKKSAFKPEKYPFSKMNIGDSFMFDLVNKKTHQQVISCAIRYRKMTLRTTGEKIEFKIRTLPDRVTARIWRTK